MDSGCSLKYSGEGLYRRIPVRGRVTCGPLSILEMIRASAGRHVNTPEYNKDKVEILTTSSYRNLGRFRLLIMSILACFEISYLGITSHRAVGLSSKAMKVTFHNILNSNHFFASRESCIRQTAYTTHGRKDIIPLNQNK